MLDGPDDDGSARGWGAFPRQHCEELLHAVRALRRLIEGRRARRVLMRVEGHLTQAIAHGGDPAREGTGHLSAWVRLGFAYREAESFLAGDAAVRNVGIAAGPPRSR